MNASLSRTAPPRRRAAAVVAPPTVSWPDLDPPPDDVAMDCPNCGATQPKTLLLTVHFATPDHPLRHSRVLRCQQCDCLFYENQTPPDYTEGAMLGRGRVAFYLQQGAGVSLITRPLARIARPPGSTYLEVGCGFGFGLDFAIREKGWQGRGIDPGQIAGLGASLLGVPIEQRYLGASEPEWNGNCDVVMASETIEHVPSPAAFVATLRRALRPGGVLILTTPGGEELHRGQSPGLLVPLLSPGLHLVFQTRASLSRLLEAAGFAHVVMETDGSSLVAYASDAPLDLEADEAVLRRAYGDYLERRAASVPETSDLFAAFAGRALQEAVNDGDMPRADRVGALLRQGCMSRFGLDLDLLDALPAEAASCSLSRLAELMPLNLGGILYADAIRHLAGGAARPSLTRRFDLAADAADAMRRALGELAMEDGMSESIAWTARAEALLCDAAAGAPDLVARLQALPVAPGRPEQAEAKRLAIAERALAGAVNAGHLALGRAIAAATGLDRLDGSEAGPSTPTRRDALFCLAVLDVQTDPEADPRRGARRFAAVLRRADGALAWQAAHGLYQALDRAWDESDAEALLAAWRHLEPPPGAAPSEVMTILARRLFVGWVNAAEYDRAADIADLVAAGISPAMTVGEGQGDMSAPMEPDPASKLSDGARDAAFCLGVLDLQPGGDVARARLWLERVRAGLQPGPGQVASDLYWAALRGELQAIDQIDGAVSARAHAARILVGIDLASAPADIPRPATPT